MISSLSAHNYNSFPATKLVIESLLADPTTPIKGRVWVNSNDNFLKYYDGTATQILGTGSGWKNTVLSISSNTTPFPTDGSNLLSLSLTSNTTLSNPLSTINQGLYILKVSQDATGGRTLNFSNNFISLDSFSINSAPLSTTHFLLYKISGDGSIFVKQLTVVDTGAVLGYIWIQLNYSNHLYRW